MPCKIVDSSFDGCAALLLNWNDTEKLSMTSIGANDNPNLEDLPEQEQVMSRPNATSATSVVRKAGQAQMMNGVTNPLTVSQYLDGETVAAGPSGGSEPHVPPRREASSVGPELASSMVAGMGAAASMGPGDQGARARVVVAELHEHRQSGQMKSAGFLSGVMRAVQAIPTAVEGIVNGNLPTVAKSPAANDAVEYASVRSSVSMDGRRDPPSEGQVPLTPLFDEQVLRRLNQLPTTAPHLYPLEAGGHDPPRPSSVTSSDIQAEVRRQLSEMMQVHEDESKRLRAHVEQLAAENRRLRQRVEVGEQQDMYSSRPGSVNPRFPGFGWFGKGLGSMMGMGAPPRSGSNLDLRNSPQYPLDSRSHNPPRSLDLGVTFQQPVQPGLTQEHELLQQLAHLQAGRVGPASISPGVPGEARPIPEQGVMGSLNSQGLATEEVRNQMIGKPLMPLPLGPKWPTRTPTPQVHAETTGEPERGPLGPSIPAEARPHVRIQDAQAAACAGIPNEGSPQADPNGLDPLNVVLTGMAQLQGLVTELAGSPKSAEKPEVIKPGVTSLPELPTAGPESCLLFSDWIHNSKPPLSDVSDTSEELWECTLREANEWYTNYLKLDPLSRLVSVPKPSEHLMRPKWSRVSRRIETMVLAALPTAVKDEVSASRVSGLLALICRLFVIYAPSSLGERELGLKHIQDPQPGNTVSDTIDGLRRWKRWCLRMSELGGTLPDPSLQIKALTRLTKNVLQSQPEIAFRINLSRHTLQVDVNPDSDKVNKLHAQLLSELEAINHRSTKEKESDREKAKDPQPNPSPKIKGVEAQGNPNPPPPPKPGKPPKGNPPVKPAAGGQHASSQSAQQSKPPCSFYLSQSGCKKGLDCTYTHDWNAIPIADRPQRCKSCGAKGHRTTECKAGLKGDEAKGQGKGAKGQPNPKTPSVPQPPPAPAPNNNMSNQQIKSMLADAALILQQSMPQNPPQGPAAQSSPNVTNTSGTSAQQTAQGTPATLASLSAQLESIRSMASEHEIRMTQVVEGDFACPLQRAEALLDSGATHAVVPYKHGMTNLEPVPVTLAGDSKDEWYRTEGGTLVVPPPELNQPPPQTILPLGALVQTLGCTISWSNKKGLKVFHPTMGLLKTGVSRNTCPFVQECQAMELIRQLEECKLKDLESQVQNLECKLREAQQPLDPTQALKKMIESGSRADVLRALMAQPYLKDIPDSVKVLLAQELPALDDKGGKEVLRGLPLKRHTRRALLSSHRWVVHLCSGPSTPYDPVVQWANRNNCEVIHVDVCNPGGKGWDLLSSQGVWVALLWGAAAGRVAAVLSSPPRSTWKLGDTFLGSERGEASSGAIWGAVGRDERAHRETALFTQGMILWSVASVAKGHGVPFFKELWLPGKGDQAANFLDPFESRAWKQFESWSNVWKVSCSRADSKGVNNGRKCIATNLVWEPEEDFEPVFSGPHDAYRWTPALRNQVVRALEGRRVVPSCEILDEIISKGLRDSREPACVPDDDEEERLIRAFEEESVLSLSDEEEPYDVECDQAARAVKQHDLSISGGIT